MSPIPSRGFDKPASATSREDKVHIGIDPGIAGGIGWVYGKHYGAVKMPNTEGDFWELLQLMMVGRMPGHSRTDTTIPQEAERVVVLEQQIPRPTKWFNPATKQWNASILKSTCLLYGNYNFVKGVLTAGFIRFQECPPKRWQSALHIPARVKGTSDSRWKATLKTVAQRIFPETRVTLHTADALLLAEYSKRDHEGRL